MTKSSKRVLKITAASMKGGPGKTNSLILLASVYADAGLRVAIIDCDENQDSYDWTQTPHCPENITGYSAFENENQLVDAVKEASTKNKIVLMDIEGRASKLGTAAMSMSDLILIPCKASVNDGKQAAKTIRTIKKTEKEFERDLRFAIVLNELPAAYRTDMLKGMEAEFERAGIAYVGRIPQRQQYRDMLDPGCGGSIYNLNGGLFKKRKRDVESYDRQLEKAREEAHDFADEVGWLIAGGSRDQGTKASDVDETEVARMLSSASSANQQDEAA